MKTYYESNEMKAGGTGETWDLVEWEETVEAVTLESASGSEGAGVPDTPAGDLQLQRGDYGAGALPIKWRFWGWD